MNVRDAFYEVLRTHGITTIFGNPGSNELPLLSDMPPTGLAFARRAWPGVLRSGWQTVTRAPSVTPRTEIGANHEGSPFQSVRGPRGS
jgi:hypothetical protein